MFEDENNINLDTLLMRVKLNRQFQQTHAHGR